MSVNLEDAFPCELCKQLIQWHQGINRVVNIGRGPGGPIGNDHICPKRVGSRFHHYEPVDPRKMFLIAYCDFCTFPHFMHMACPICYDEEGHYIGKVSDYRTVKQYKLQFRIIRNKRIMEYLDPGMNTWVSLGDVHDPEAWKELALIQRNLLELLNVK